jgi:hypothetical protein
MDWFEIDSKNKQNWAVTQGTGKIEKSTCAGVSFFGGPSKAG